MLLDESGTQTGQAGDQQPVQEKPHNEHHRPGQQRGGERPGGGAQHRQQPPAAEQVKGRLHPQHQELTLGEVHDPHDAEDHTKVDAHQPVEAADHQAGSNGVDQRR